MTPGKLLGANLEWPITQNNTSKQRAPGRARQPRYRGRAWHEEHHDAGDPTYAGIASRQTIASGMQAAVASILCESERYRRGA